MQFGRYQVVRMVGQGGMATVYEACDPRLNQRVAIKVLHAALASSPELVARFEAEARIVNGIHHPGIVAIYDLARLRDGVVYHVMEFLDGETLAHRMVRRVTARLEFDEILRIVRQIADTLCTVHFHGIVHRDLKPDNLMLVPDAFVPGGVRVKILDFGLAKVLNDNAKPHSVDTQIGVGLGTVDYIAPEQILDARNANDRADVYSLGCILFELAAGRKPFTGDTTVQILGGHLTRPAPDLLDISPRQPRDFANLVAAMLAKEPDERPTMRRVFQELDTVSGAWERQGSDTIIMQPGSFPGIDARTSPRRALPPPYEPGWLRRALPVLAASAAAGCLPWLVFLQTCLPRNEPALSAPMSPAPAPEPPSSASYPKRALPPTSLPSLSSAHSSAKAIRDVLAEPSGVAMR